MSEKDKIAHAKLQGVEPKPDQGDELSAAASGTAAPDALVAGKKKTLFGTATTNLNPDAASDYVLVRPSDEERKIMEACAKEKAIPKVEDSVIEALEDMAWDGVGALAAGMAYDGFDPELTRGVLVEREPNAAKRASVLRILLVALNTRGSRWKKACDRMNPEVAALLVALCSKYEISEKEGVQGKTVLTLPRLAMAFPGANLGARHQLNEEGMLRVIGTPGSLHILLCTPGAASCIPKAAVDLYTAYKAWALSFAEVVNPFKVKKEWTAETIAEEKKKWSDSVIRFADVSHNSPLLTEEKRVELCNRYGIIKK